MSPNEVEGVEGMGSTGKVGSVREGLLHLRGWKEDSGGSEEVEEDLLHGFRTRSLVFTHSPEDQTH